MQEPTLIQTVPFSNVGATCVTVSRKSGRMFACGSRNGELALHALGHAKPLFALRSPAPDAAAISCIQFDPTEERIASATTAGAVIVWDMRTSAVAAQISAATANGQPAPTLVDFHPYGSFAAVAHGSQLTLWDLKNTLSAMKTYYDSSADGADSSPVTSLRFSPDGAWITTGTAAGVVCIWELQSGRLLHRLTGGHTAAVSALEYHPDDLVLASAGADGFVCLWDLERFALHCRSQIAPNGPVSGLAFHAGGRALITAAQGELRLLENLHGKTLATIPMPQATLTSLSFTTHKGSEKIVGAEISGDNVNVWMSPMQAPKRAAENTRPNVAPARPVPSEGAPVAAPAPREPTATTAGDASAAAASAAKRQRQQAELHAKMQADRQRAGATQPKAAETTSLPAAVPQVSASAHPADDPSSASSSLSAAVRSESAAARPAAAAPQPPSTSGPQRGLSLGSFAGAADGAAELGADEIFGELSKPHAAMAGILSQRLTKIRVISRLWASGQGRQAVDACLQTRDQAVIVDVLRLTLSRKELYPLELCAELVPLLHELLRSEFEDYVVAGLGFVKQTLKAHSTSLKSAKSDAFYELCEMRNECAQLGRRSPKVATAAKDCMDWFVRSKF